MKDRRLADSNAIIFFGLHFDVLNLRCILGNVQLVPLPKGVAYHLVNASTITEASTTPALKAILKQDSLICDGKPLALLLHSHNSDLEQIRGSDLMQSFLSERNDSESHYFLGSTEDVLLNLVKKARLLNPEIKIAGTFSPPFSDDTQPDVEPWILRIQASGATCVWVGLGTPKQDFVVHEIAKRLPVKAFAVGAAFNYLSGDMRQAPRIFRFLYLEWLYRLAKEPRRLKSRYLVGNFQFLAIALKELFGNKNKKAK